MYYIYAEKLDDSKINDKKTFFSRTDSREKMKGAISLLKKQGFRFTVITGSETVLNYGDEKLRPEISLDM